MSKILFLVNHDVVIYNFRLELVERLISDGHEVWISSPYGERIDNLTELGAKHIEAEFSRHGMNPIAELKLLKYYKKIIKDIKPDIVFTYTIKPNIYGALASKAFNVPCIVNITGLGNAIENGGISRLITVTLYKMALKKVQKVFFQNEENMKFFTDRGICINKNALLPGSGVNIERFNFRNYPKGDTTEFVFIGRIMKEKGIDNYLEAAEIVKRKYPNTVFHVCGFCEQEYDGVLQKHIDNKTVIYHGMLNDVKPIIEKSNAIVLPSYHEGMANVLLEASSMGRPVIASKVHGCIETFDEGKTGLGFEAENTDDLCKTLIKFIEMPSEEKEKMGKKAREKMEREFNRQIVVEAYLQELNDKDKIGGKNYVTL